MKKRAAYAIALIVIAALLVYLGARSAGANEVVEFARVASYTTTERRVFKISDEKARHAVDSLRAMGPKADRALIRLLQQRDNVLSRSYQLLWARAPAAFQRRFPRPLAAVKYRQMAVAAIGKMAVVSLQTEHALLGALADPDLMVRARATMILGYRGSPAPATVQAFARSMSDSNIASQVIAPSPQDVMREFRFAPASIAEMILDLNRPFSEARYAAARALARQGPAAQPAVPALIRALNDSSEMVRIASIRALGAIGPAASNALPLLRPMLDDQSSFIQAAANHAIPHIEARHPNEPSSLR